MKARVSIAFLMLAAMAIPALGGVWLGSSDHTKVGFVTMRGGRLECDDITMRFTPEATVTVGRVGTNSDRRYTGAVTRLGARRTRHPRGP